MNGKRSGPLVVISLFLTLFILAAILLSFLDSYFQNIIQVRFTPREQVIFDFSHLFRRLQPFWVWLVGIFVIGSVVTYLISKSVLLSRIFVVLVSMTALGFAIFAYYVLSQPCEELGCIGSVFGLWLAEASWLIAGASIPILLSASLKDTSNLIKSKLLWMNTLITLICISLLWYITTSLLRAESTKTAATAQRQIQEIYSDQTFPVYEPSYLPPVVGKIGQEWTADRGDSVDYVRWYHYGPTKVLSFEILETKPKTSKTNDEYLQEDLRELQAKQEKFKDDELYAYNLEVITIKQSPALVYTEHSLQRAVVPVVQLYIEGVRIKISVNVGAEQLPKEELIKIAESLQRIN
ncbi:MAG: hypothetical protein AAB414_04875 [Patescibacteria group bacterium]